MAGAQFPRDKVVDILNRLRIGRLRNLGSGARNLHFLKVSNPSLVPNQPLLNIYSAVSYPDVQVTVK